MTGSLFPSRRPTRMEAVGLVVISPLLLVLIPVWVVVIAAAKAMDYLGLTDGGVL